jgi:hypothetical protein
MLEHLAVCDDPLIIGDKFVPDGRGGDCGGEEGRNQSGVAGRHSHSIVAGGFELTS